MRSEPTPVAVADTGAWPIVVIESRCAWMVTNSS